MENLSYGDKGARDCAARFAGVSEDTPRGLGCRWIVWMRRVENQDVEFVSRDP